MKIVRKCNLEVGNKLIYCLMMILLHLECSNLPDLLSHRCLNHELFIYLFNYYQNDYYYHYYIIIIKNS